MYSYSTQEKQKAETHWCFFSFPFSHFGKPPVFALDVACYRLSEVLADGSLALASWVRLARASQAQPPCNSCR